ncbi:MAG TPA: diguanylate cyclase, partial [Egibacteraceae bacterium]|nr:diguanylate cyclase [Egibacteraceae bacterium]
MEAPFTERSMRRIRAAGVVLAVVELSLVPHPPAAAWLVESLLVAVPLMLLGANAVSLWAPSWRLGPAAQIVLDAGVALSVIGGLGFEPQGSLWVLLALPIAEGALRWGMGGVVRVWAGVLPLHALVWDWGYARFGVDPLDLESVGYRSGMLLLLGSITGVLSGHLGRQAAELQRALRESERRAELLRTVAATGRRLPVEDLGSLLDAVAGSAMALGFDAAELALVDPRTEQRITAAHRGLPEEAAQPRPIDRGLVGEVWRTGRTVVIEDYSSWAGADPQVLRVGLRQAIGVPVWVSGAVEGVLCAGWLRSRTVGSDEMECLEMLAVEAGAALAASRRLEDQQAYAEQLRRQARRDALTGLANRGQLLEVVRARAAEVPAALLFVDLDRFKHVNDSYGHAGGDQLLRAVSARMGGAVRPPDVIARFGGDEFVVLLQEADEIAAVRVAERLHETLREPFTVFNRPVRVSASIGVALLPPGGDPHLALVQADMAMYAAKQSRKRRTAVHDERLHREALRRVRIEVDLHGVEERGELSVAYQPLCLPDGRGVVGAEALLRWTHPELGVVGPSEFVPMAERIDCLRPIGWWLVATACEQLARWRERDPSFCLWLNVSPGQLTEPGFVPRLSMTLGRLRLPGSALVLELTESPLLAEDVAAARAAMADLHQLGVRMVADDFGQESSSLG